MWEVYRLPFRGNFSLRAFVALITAAILTTLFGALLNATPVVAAPEKAEWQNGNVIYNAREYQPDTTQNIPGVPAGATVFSRKDEANGKVSVLYYEQGADTTKDTKIKIAEYTLNNDGTYSNPGPPTEHTLEAKSAADEKTTQCSIAGVGWIVCTLSRWIAGSMDKIFDIIANYLVVQPITTQTDSPLYKAWETARSIANLCFVLAFLLIIYAQITSQGLNNYEIKKMIPRLIIAAILVNISYYICSIAVDISNILGHGIQQIFVDIRKSIPLSNGNFEALTWKNVTEYIMSGGTVVVAGIVGIKAMADAGGIGAMALMLSPVLVGALIAVLIAVLILAARQALIIILIVVSPLAFVAMLLPNTEKWFEKWRELLTTMLMVFPMFSLLFGGSQLASHIIVGTADQFSVLLLALFVQAAPLALTPFLLKFSGSLLGRFAGMLDDPKKGIVDRTRNWAKENNDVRRAKRMEEMARSGGKGGTALQRMGYKREMDRRDRKAWIDGGEKWMQAGWENDERSHAHHRAAAQADVIEKLGKTKAELEVADMKINNVTIARAIGQAKLNEDKTKNLDAKREAAWEETRAGHTATGAFASYARFAAEAAQESREAKALAQRSAIAQAAQSMSYANNILTDSSLAAEAGGIDGERGVLLATASATQTIRADFGKGASAADELMKHFGLDSGQVHALAMRQSVDSQGRSIVGTDTQGNSYTFSPEVDYMFEAAVAKDLKENNYENIKEIIKRSGTDEYLGVRSTIKDAIVTNNIPAKAVFMGGQSIDLVGQGEVKNETSYLKLVASTIGKGKIDQSALVTNDANALEDIVKIAEHVSNNRMGDIGMAGDSNRDGRRKLSAELSELYLTAYKTLTNKNISDKLKPNAKRELIKLAERSGKDMSILDD